MHFDFKDLQLFVAAAESGSIAGAAERTHTVASAASKRLSDLERAFGASLLVRGAKGVVLTTAGHALLKRARALLTQAGQLEAELAAHARGMRGYVRVFANISAIVEFLPTALAAFATRHPDVQVHLEEHVSSVIADAVAGNGADLGIVSELPAIEGLELTPFRNDELVVVARADHPIAKRAEASLRELLEDPLVGLHAGSSLHELLARAAAEAGKTLAMRIHVTSFDAACAMIAAGLGLGVMPLGATTAYTRSLQLTSVRLAEPWAERQLFLCTRAGETLHPAARLLLEHLRSA